jgi:hypothetical protein
VIAGPVGVIVGGIEGCGVTAGGAGVIAGPVGVAIGASDGCGVTDAGTSVGLGHGTIGINDGSGDGELTIKFELVADADVKPDIIDMGISWPYITLNRFISNVAGLTKVSVGTTGSSDWESYTPSPGVMYTYVSATESK